MLNRLACLGAMVLVASGCSGGASSLERSIVTSLTKAGIISPDGPSRQIDYKPRAPLVLPSSLKLSAPVLPPEDKKLTPRELAAIYYPDDSKLSLKQYEALIAKRREIDAKGQGVRKINLRGTDNDEEARIRYIRRTNLSVPRESYFKPLKVPKQREQTSEAQ